MRKLFFVPMLFFVLFSTVKGIDFSDPVLVVEAACIFLMRGDYDLLLLLTEESERQKTLMIISNLQSHRNARAWLKEEMDKLVGYEIVRAEIYTNNQQQFAVVTTRWRMRNPSRDVSEFSTPEERARVRPYFVTSVDYLLRKFDGKWKIISTRTRQ